LDRQHYRWAFFIIVFLLASVYFFVFSESGLLERIALDREKSSIEAGIEALKSDNKNLQRLLKKYRAGEYPEGEIADSGYIKNGSSVLLFRDTGKMSGSKKPKKKQEEYFHVPLPYLRILWISLSALIIAGLIVFGRKFSENT
jgi:hypothetical protein